MCLSTAEESLLYITLEIILKTIFYNISAMCSRSDTFPFTLYMRGEFVTVLIT